ncbi:hypothetical protein GJAV_G00044840 [Gymnothorax javanicus]|nr:hypothetical protein GJAV_G00044840 [Gymnothorax javanicus]
MKAINLDTYCLSLLAAKEDILNPRSSTNWALFTYTGITNNLKLSDSGVGGVNELAGKFLINRPLYGLCRVGMDGQGPSRIVLIIWVGEGVDEYRRAECASHVPAVKAFFREAHVFINAHRPEEVTEEEIKAIISKLNAPKERAQRACMPAEKEETVGTNYKKTVPAMEFRRFSRDSFWARAEKEEEDRKEEECRRAVEDRRRREREWVLQEHREAEERERKMIEKEQMIQKQRKLQAEIEAEARKQEKLKWEQQQREHAEEMRASFRHSESIEKAAEAADLVSQRSMNPREFFRQLSSSSSRTPSNPGSPRTVRHPFRRYQRSLTDTALIFGKPGSSTPPTSPCSPTVVSPFTRTPSSPHHGSLSPPSSECSDTTFLPIAEPHPPQAFPKSPPSSPHRPAPVSSVPSPPPSRPLPPLSPKPQSPTLPHGKSVPELKIRTPPAPNSPGALTSPGPVPSLPQTQSSSPPLLSPLESCSSAGAPTRPLPADPEVTSRVGLAQSAGLKAPGDPEVQATGLEVENGVAEESNVLEENTEANLIASETNLNPAGDLQLSNLPPAIDTTVEGTVSVLDSISPGKENEALETGPEGKSSEDGDGNETEEAEAQAAPSQGTSPNGEAYKGQELETVSHPHEESDAAGDRGVSPPQEPSSPTTNGMSPEERGRDEDDENGASLEPSGTGEGCSLSELDDDLRLSPRAREHDGMEEVLPENQGKGKANNGEQCSDTDGRPCIRTLYDHD